MGCFPANGFGLYDMVGNVWEWTRSCYGDYPQSDETREDFGFRVMRGGSVNCGPDDARCAKRGLGLMLPRLHLRRFSRGVASCPCFLALVSGSSQALWLSGSGGGAGSLPRPRDARGFLRGLAGDALRFRFGNYRISREPKSLQQDRTAFRRPQAQGRMRQCQNLSTAQRGLDSGSSRSVSSLLKLFSASSPAPKNPQ